MSVCHRDRLCGLRSPGFTMQLQVKREAQATVVELELRIRVRHGQ